jgi:chemotaxis protein MotB
VLLLGGCVTRGSYHEVVAARDRLAGEAAGLGERVQLLEASNESLSQERLELIASVEDLRQERQTLGASVAELEQLRDQLSESLRTRDSALEQEQAEIGLLQQAYDALVSDLQQEVATGRIEIEQLREGLRVNMAQEILFRLGSARLNPEGQRVLRTVALRLENLPNRIEVQGHTDDLPIHGQLARRFPSNWELGGARAARVLQLFVEVGLEPARLHATSFGATRPIASNETAEGRARNRRIEIRLLPDPAGELAREASQETRGPSLEPGGDPSRAERKSEEPGEESAH